jgi:hypothetical protein
VAASRRAQVAVVVRSLSVLSKPLMREGEQVCFPLLPRSCRPARSMLSARQPVYEVDDRCAYYKHVLDASHFIEVVQAAPRKTLSMPQYGLWMVRTC